MRKTAAKSGNKRGLLDAGSVGELWEAVDSTTIPQNSTNPGVVLVENADRDGLVEVFAERGQGRVEVGVGEAHLRDRIHRVHHGRVVLGKDLSDFGKTQIEDLADEIHGDLPWQGDGPAVGAALEIGHPDSIVLCDKADDVRRRGFALIGEKLEERHPDDIDVDPPAPPLPGTVGDDSGDG